MKALIAICAAAVLLAGCEARINTNDAASFTKSIAAVTKDMSAAEKTAFGESMVAIAFDTSDPKTMGAFTPDAGSPLVLLAVQDKVKGKTGKGVIKLGYETRIKSADEQLTKMMAEVQQAKAERAKHKATFDAITISSPRFRIEESMFMDEPAIEFTITNGTQTAIRRGFFHGTVTSEGRSIPWVDEDFSYEFVGGLEPGETGRLKLAPNMFGNWNVKELKGRDDVNLAVTLVNLEGANGETLLTGDPGETASKEREMVALQTQKKDLQAKLAAM